MILRALGSRFHFRNPVVVNKKKNYPCCFIVENTQARQQPNEKEGPLPRITEKKNKTSYV